jgi:prolyl 4-hydroxylase
MFIEPTLMLNGFTLKRKHTAPNIYVIDNFLTKGELDYLDTFMTHGKFQKSFVDQVGSETKSLYDNDHRSSTFLSFNKQHSARIAAMEQKAASLLGCYSSHCVEPLQLVRYLPGQSFGPHHDMADLQDDGSVVIPPRSLFCKRRIVTLFCYLNTVPEGGATCFPQCGPLRVMPVRGRAVFFANVLSNGLPDPRTVHAGEPVPQGVKYGLNIWLCER